MMEGVATFKYMGETLDQTDDDCTAVRQKIMFRKFGLGEVGGTADTGRGGKKGVHNILQGGGTRNPTFWS